MRNKFSAVMFAVFASLVLTGCASSIMKGYIGKPITAVISDYGFPAGAYDVEANKRAFVWQKNDALIFPGQTFATGSMVGNQMFMNTYSSPTFSSSFSCSYTFYATRTRTDIEGPAAWTIVEFEKPKLSCE
jgi:hypothetical protein